MFPYASFGVISAVFDREDQLRTNTMITWQEGPANEKPEKKAKIKRLMIKKKDNRSGTLGPCGASLFLMVGGFSDGCPSSPLASCERQSVGDDGGRQTLDCTTASLSLNKLIVHK